MLGAFYHDAEAHSPRGKIPQIHGGRQASQPSSGYQISFMHVDRELKQVAGFSLDRWVNEVGSTVKARTS